MKCDAVLDGESGEHPVTNEAMVLGAPVGLGVVVDAVGVGQEAQTAHPAWSSVEGAEGLVEPAQRAGRGAAQDDAPPPGLAQDLVQPVRVPGAEHAHHVSAAHVDEVLREQVGREVVLDAAGALVAPEERDVAGLAGGREAAVEAHDVVVGVAGRRRQEADARAAGFGEREHVVVEQRMLALHREASAAKGDDLRGLSSHRSAHRRRLV